MPGSIYSNIENLVLGGRSESSGFAVLECYGVLTSRHHPSWMKSKPSLPGQDFLLFGGMFDCGCGQKIRSLIAFIAGVAFYLNDL